MIALPRSAFTSFPAMKTPNDVLDFWFLTPDQPGYGKPRVEWFRKDAAFDEAIRARFGGLITEALAGGLRDWCATAEGALAYILVLDQFTRNVFRDTTEAFAGDALNLAAAVDALDRGFDMTLPPLRRWFVYMPLEHAEDVAMQDRCVALFTALAAEDGAFADALDYAVRHRDIVARFGRFPHRNAVLGRASTPEEIEFLTLPGSRF
ncbi:MAG TPA: DUF924 family protein [Rhodocyclaceae bacterium]|nr:DUF924 family protein [Rhodocyclaceae bacterium]